MRVRILLTNDDGVYAPGLRALRTELMTIGEVTVVAPASEQSAVGHSITLLTPLIVQEVRDEQNRFLGWAVEGKPADCVKVALLELLPEPPDLVVSGLNAGSNAGINVLYSGTVAAAIEAAFFRCVSVAVSLEYTKPGPLDFARAAAIARRVIEQLAGSPTDSGHALQYQHPQPGPRSRSAACAWCRSTWCPYSETLDRRVDPRGRVYFWTKADLVCPDTHPDSDVGALAEGYVTVTPLQFNLTHAALLEQMGKWGLEL